MGKPRYGKDNFMFEKGLALSVWTTDGCFVGDFKTRKQIIKQFKIAKRTIQKYYKLGELYFPKNSVFGYYFYNIVE